jgi:hypothetical protein
MRSAYRLRGSGTIAPSPLRRYARAYAYRGLPAFASLSMAGSGINDAIALKKAHVSVSVRGAATAATDTAQVVLMKADLGRVVRLFDLATEASSTLDQTYTSVVLPSLTGALGALFFGLGFVPAVFLNQLGLGAGLGVATKPLLRGSASQRHA